MLPCSAYTVPKRYSALIQTDTVQGGENMQDRMDDLLRAIEQDEVRSYVVEVRELKRKEQRRTWSNANMATVSARVSREEARRFKALCRAKGTTMYRVIGGYVRAMLAQHGC